jgi:hypothetical protein
VYGIPAGAPTDARIDLSDNPARLADGSLLAQVCRPIQTSKSSEGEL